MNYKDSTDAAKGSPNPEALQYLQENWGQAEINNSLQVVKTEITASGSSGVAVVGMPQGAEIISIKVHGKATIGGGTVTLSVGDGGAAISDAIIMATLDAVTEVSTIDQTYKKVSADGLTLTTNADTNLGDVYIYYKK